MSIPHQTFLIKPSSSNCNLNCNYCFYHEIAKDRTHHFGLMSLEMVDVFLNKVFDDVVGSVNFMFQGGEPLLVGIEYYRYFIDKVAEYNKNAIPVYYSIQTNGLAINNEFASFFKDNNILIGISLDGPKEIHDYYRDESFDKVMNSIHILKENEVAFNILTVVTNMTIGKEEDIYNFFKENDFNYMQFIPFLEVNERNASVYRPSPKEYGDFLIKLYDLWEQDILNGKEISISIFEDFIKNMLRLGGATCGMNGICSLNLVLEANGNMYPCDFYTNEEDLLGNIKDNTLMEIVSSNKARTFIQESRNYHKECQTCPYRMVCKGGCKAYKNSNNMYYYCRSFKSLFNERRTQINNMATFFYNKLFKHQQ